MRLRALVTTAAVALVGAALVPVTAYVEGVPTASAQKKGKGKASAKAKKKKRKLKPGEIGKRLRLSPRGIKWGISNERIARVYDKVFEKEFVPLYKRAGAGPRVKALDDELAAKKRRLRRSRIKFGKVPTGLDNSPLNGEYSYNNGESMTQLQRPTKTQYFFFFKDKLWKVYEERKLKKGGALGADFEAAIKKLTKKFGSAPIMHSANPAKKVFFDYAEWSDGVTYLRVVNRDYEKKIAIVYISKSVQDNLANYRKNKPKKDKLDKDVQMATRKGKGDPVDPNKDAAEGISKKKKKK